MKTIKKEIINKIELLSFIFKDMSEFTEFIDGRTWTEGIPDYIVNLLRKKLDIPNDYEFNCLEGGAEDPSDLLMEVSLEFVKDTEEEKII